MAPWLLLIGLRSGPPATCRCLSLVTLWPSILCSSPSSEIVGRDSRPPAILASMTTRALEDLDGGLGSCLPSQDLSLLEEPSPGRRPESKARGSSRMVESGSWPLDSVAAAAADVRPQKMAKEPLLKGSPGPGKERLKAGASPRSAPARKKSQASSPQQPPSEDLPWGNVTLNKCLVLASLLALLGSAFQVCRDTVAGEAPVSTPAPQPWVPPKKPASPPTKPVALAPPPRPPVPQAETKDRPEAPQTSVTENLQGAPEEESPGKGPGEEELVPLEDRGSQKRPRKDKPRKEDRQTRERPRKEKPRKERPRKERPWTTREPQEALPRSGETLEGRHRPGVRDPRDQEHKKHQVWASPRRHEGDDWPPGRRKHRAGKGRD